MFTVYAEKEIFENIILFNNETPNWYKIFCNHSEVCLNMTDAELVAEEVPETPIFEFIQANGGRSPKALSQYFAGIYADYSIISEQPRSAFFLNITDLEANVIQSKFGVIVQGKNNIEDTILKGSFFKDLTNDAVFENHLVKGWKHLVNFPLPPSNSMVISDEYLFSNDEDGLSIGKSNVIQLIDSFLPSNLSVPYHILILGNDQPEERKAPRSEAWCMRIATEIKTEVSALRNYSVIIEVVFSETIHKRKLILNYLNATSDKGFSVFKVNDGKTVRDNNDFRCDRLFNRIDPSEGDTDFVVAENILIQLKKKCASVKQFVGNAGQMTHNRILGDCNPDFSLKNRLINDV